MLANAAFARISELDPRSCSDIEIAKEIKFAFVITPSSLYASTPDMIHDRADTYLYSFVST
jgi:hypothetical protein